MSGLSHRLLSCACVSRKFSFSCAFSWSKPPPQQVERLFDRLLYGGKIERGLALALVHELEQLYVKEQTFGMLDEGFDSSEEAHSPASVDQTMVVGQRDIHHRSDAHFSIDGNGSFLDRVHA